MKDSAAEALLNQAQEVMDLQSESRVMTRTAALIARQALESALEKFWYARGFPEVAHVSMRAQLICLNEFSNEKLAEDTSHIWWTLSRACHHHPYELAPTYEEINSWLAKTGEVVSEL